MSTENRPQKHKQQMSLPLFLVWGVLTLIVVLFVTLPFAEDLVVCVVRGPYAFFHDGVRIIGSRPARFSDTGALVPGLPSAIILLSGCGLTMFVVGGIVLAAARGFERFLSRKDVA